MILAPPRISNNCTAVQSALQNVERLRNLHSVDKIFSVQLSIVFRGVVFHGPLGDMQLISNLPCGITTQHLQRRL